MRHRKSPSIPSVVAMAGLALLMAASAPAGEKPSDTGKETSSPRMPTIPGLKPLTPQRIPGVGHLRGGNSPCLTADLKMIVFANWKDHATEYDLYQATRDKIERPFAAPTRIETTVTPWTEAYAALSADGLELVYISVDDLHPEKMPKLCRSIRSDRKLPFGRTSELSLPAIDAARRRLSNPQFIDHQRLKLCLIESPAVRTVLTAARGKAGAPFETIDVLPLVNHWPLWWLSADGLRAYANTEQGICVSVRGSPDARFGAMTVVVPPQVTGMVDGPIWLPPQEDVVFYCSAGADPKPGDWRNLWMVAFDTPLN